SAWHSCGANRNAEIEWVLDNTNLDRWQAVSGMCSGGCITQNNANRKTEYCWHILDTTPEVSSLDEVELVTCANPEESGTPLGYEDKTCSYILDEQGYGIYCCY